MKHHKNIRKFGRNTDQRKALMNSLAYSLIKNEKIKTTEAKAKELRPFIERLVTYGKKGGLYNHRRLVSVVGESGAKKMMEVLSEKYKDRNGGYTRIVKISPRTSDGSPMGYIEFV